MLLVARREIQRGVAANGIDKEVRVWHLHAAQIEKVVVLPKRIEAWHLRRAGDQRRALAVHRGNDARSPRFEFGRG